MENSFLENFEDYKNNKKFLWYYKDYYPVNIYNVTSIVTHKDKDKNNYLITFYSVTDKTGWIFDDEEERDMIFDIILKNKGFDLGQLVPKINNSGGGLYDR
jgi:hypothetical protein